MKIQIRFFRFRIVIELSNRKGNYHTTLQKRQSFTAKKLWDSKWKHRRIKV